jgi:RNA polymerase sigma-70 factor, ECF subfamily
MTSVSQAEPDGLSPTLARSFAELWRRTNAQRFGIDLNQFRAVLEQVGRKYLPPDANEQQAIQFYETLKHDELVLARACAAGHEDAWAEFMARYRGKLYDAAYSIAHEEATGRELADSIYAELYGIRERGEQRVSKLNYYMGRGSLEGWLRTVLAQAFVDRYRKGKNQVSLDERVEAGEQFVATQSAGSENDTRLDAATDAALASCSSDERLIMAAYYLDGRTLADIGRLLGVHESTASRKLDRALRGLRERILKELRRAGLRKHEAEEALASDVRDVRVDVRKHLAQETRGRPFLPQDQETKRTTT